MTPQAQQEIEEHITELCEEYGIDEQAFILYCDNHHITMEHEDHINEFMNSYVGQWYNFLEFATMHFNDTMDIPDHLSDYIDYEAYARDLQHEYWEEQGYIFQSI